MLFDKMSRNGQPETKPAVSACRPAVGLAEAIEYERQEFGRDADAGIFDLDIHRAVVGFASKHNRSFFSGELDGIREHIAQHLMEPFRICFDRWQIGLNLLANDD